MTGSSVSDSTECVITPNHLLTSKSEVLTSLPPAKFAEDELYGRKQWRVVQRFAEEFWNAWKGDYLRELTAKQKWAGTSKSVKEGDVVILKEADVPRNVWKIGRVTGTTPGRDGLVRNVQVTLGNKNLDRKGKPMAPPTARGPALVLTLRS